MPMTIQRLQGTFVSAGNPVTLSLSGSPGFFEIFNFTQANANGATSVAKRAWWQQGMASGSYMGIINTSSALTDQMFAATTGGFTAFDLASPPTGSSYTISSVSQASSAVITTSAPHTIPVGALVRLTNVTGQQQLSGYVAQVTAVGASTITIPIDSSGFANAGSGGTVQQVYRSIMVPPALNIVKITQAASAVVSFAQAHNYVVGDQIQFNVPSGWGMTQINGLIGQISAVSTFTVTVNINSAAFTAFAFPLTAAANITKAQAVLIGNFNTSPNDPNNNTGYSGILLGSAVCGTASDVMYWTATFPDEFQTSVAT